MVVDCDDKYWGKSVSNPIADPTRGWSLWTRPPAAQKHGLPLGARDCARAADNQEDVAPGDNEREGKYVSVGCRLIKAVMLVMMSSLLTGSANAAPAT